MTKKRYGGFPQEFWDYVDKFVVTDEELAEARANRDAGGGAVTKTEQIPRDWVMVRTEDLEAVLEAATQCSEYFRDKYGYTAEVENRLAEALTVYRLRKDL